jgi:hypothetical protein
MAVATSNRLLPLLAGAVVLMLAFVTLKSCTGEQEAPLVMEAVPQAPAPDADSPADTIKTLTANVAAMTTEAQLGAGITATLLRLSVGIEHTPDLISDISTALAHASRARLGLVNYA